MRNTVGPSPRLSRSGTPLKGSDRALAALSHLGVPLYGPFLSLGIFYASGGSSFRQRHANQAFALQCIVSALWVPAVVLMATGLIEPLLLVVFLALVLIVELPNIIRALQGRFPIVIVPLSLLRSNIGR